MGGMSFRALEAIEFAINWSIYFFFLIFPFSLSRKTITTVTSEKPMIELNKEMVRASVIF